MRPVSQKAGTLREILLANVALVRPDAGVRQNVLIKITARGERFLAQDASQNLRLAVLVSSVTYQLAGSAIFFPALLALETLLVKPQVIVQPAPVQELLATQVTSVLVSRLFAAFLMPPLVALHVLHLLAAESTDLQLRRVRSLRVVRQVCLQLVTTTAELAHVLRLVVAVSAHVVPLQAVLALVFYAADLALEKVIRPMDHLVLLQRANRVIRSFTHVAFVRFSVHVRHVVLHFLRVVETLLAEGTGVLDLVQRAIHFDFVEFL